MLRLGNTARSALTTAVALSLALVATARAEDELPRLLTDLNADRYETRHEAAVRLAKLGQRDELQPRLAAEYQRLLLDTSTPWEVREAVQTLRIALKVKDVPQAATTRETASEKDTELDKLLDELRDNHSNVRAAAAERMQWLLGQPEWIAPTMAKLKQRLAVGGIELTLRRQLEALYDAARGAWLLSDAKDVQLPDISKEQLRQWVDLLARGENPSAERELLEALARDDVMPRVKAALEARLADGDLTPDGRTRLMATLEQAHPAMVAEFWRGVRHEGIQHLLLGVPNKPENAERASLFDRCDERTAHCVSGNSLSPGDYPVGVFFPHPMQDAQFHLVNLPTPRRRMAYEFDVKRDASTRFVEISRRTLARILDEKRLLSEAEFHLLEQLDASSLSTFIGPYLLAVDDAPLSLHVDPRFQSHHRLLCFMIGRYGTAEAVPGLVGAIDSKRFFKDGSATPLAAPWSAALAIAHRAPWPGVDAWLADLVASGLLLSADERTTVGATAAGLLLTRHETAVATMGLICVEDDLLSETLGIPEYRFVDPSKVDDVLRWWASRKDAAEGQPTSGKSNGVAP